MIKYLGSKRVLAPRILELAQGLDGVRSACDLFAGTTRIAQGFKRLGWHVHANDNTAYGYVLAKAFIEVDRSTFPEAEARATLEHLNALPGTVGYATRTFAREARYFQEPNAQKIDAIRQAIDPVTEPLRSILLTSLLLAADRVDSTTGVQMAYLKGWAPRSFQPLTLLMPELLPGPGVASQEDALNLASEVDADLVYLDPPYNQHSYVGNYHVWETLVLNDEPEAYGVARKRVDCRTRKSPFNRKHEAAGALEHVIASLRCRYLILSFNDEGYVPRRSLEAMLSKWGEYTCEAVPHRRYVGARIGVYNPQGKKVGSVGHLTNHEFLFVARRHG